MFSWIKCFEVNRLFVLLYTNQDVNSKRLKARALYYQKI